MLSVNDREWKEFFVSDIFTIKSGKRLTKSDMDNGNRPFIGATDSNNGITNFTQNVNISLDKNVLGVNYNGSVVENFYHPYECIFSDDVKRFSFKNNKYSNKYIYLFFKSIILQQKVKYAYGYKFNEQRMKKQIILVPVTQLAQPDWKFMEDYIKERYFLLSKQCIEHMKLQLPTYKEIPSFNDKMWDVFPISIICDIVSGKDIYESERVDGNMPYITSTALNNGIKYFVSNVNETIEGDAISVNRNGSVGYAFYHKYNALYSNDCRKLRLKNKYNPYISLFIANQITMQRGKYSYGYKMGTARLKRQGILLPISQENIPDWEYMEQFSKNIIHEKITKYLNFYDVQS